MLSQLDNDINAQQDCVATCVASALKYLTHNEFTGGQVKDAVYGANYVGPTNPLSYVKYCSDYGVQMTAINGSPNYLVEVIHNHLVVGEPCIVTVPDRYAPASLGWTHVLVAFGCNGSSIGTGSITLLDPYIAKPVTYGNAELAGLLRFDQMWVLSGGEMVLSINQASQFFEEVQPNEVWKCKQTGFTISHGNLAYYRSCTKEGLNGISMFGLPLSNETAIPGYTGCTIQRYERSCVIYDPEHKIDRVPGIDGPCYPAHIDKGAGRDPVIAQLLSENSQLVNEVAQLKQQLAEAKLPPTISTEKQ